MVLKICHGFTCNAHNLQLQIYHTTGYHLKVVYPQNVSYPVHLRTEAIAYPTGHKWYKRTFYSYRINSVIYFTLSESSYSWFTSTIYHINCSIPSNETSYWSGFSINLTKKVCSEEQMADSEHKTWNSVVLRSNISEYILQ